MKPDKLLNLKAFRQVSGLRELNICQRQINCTDIKRETLQSS